MKFFDRLQCAWNMLMDRLTKQQVLRLSHELLHQGFVDPECETCFTKHFEDYLCVCTEVLIALGKPDRIAGFEAHMREIAGTLKDSRIILLQEHPAFAIAGYLGITTGPEITEIIDKTMAICDALPQETKS